MASVLKSKLIMVQLEIMVKVKHLYFTTITAKVCCKLCKLNQKV